MVKNSIKIYARLKQENQAKTIPYKVEREEEHETITFRLGGIGDFINNKPQSHKFRKVSRKSLDEKCNLSIFQKVFDQDSQQAEVFSEIAKPVIDKVLEGFNGTIFAYGQTGSGKTYAITGSAEAYDERGLIPRSIEDIFNSIKKASDKYTIYISYLEIYNEIGYDLLNPRHKISSLDELPKVILLEDGKGESHLRNLSIHEVSSEEEAMKLLFLGDTNRTVTETPMNVYSSRSHCIFTIRLISKNITSEKIRRSTLNLVDLAGSERINKCNISGMTLNEAKYINLSLHYLERVVLALSQKSSHIPFRNSMLTYVLRNTLSGNCLTVLLATLAINRNSIEETISTCKFAQRVAEVNIQTLINDEINPQQEIQYLKHEIESLRKQLKQQSRFNTSRTLSDGEKQHCKEILDNYLNDTTDELPFKYLNVSCIQYCVKLFKEVVKEFTDQALKLQCAENTSNELIEQYKHMIEEREDEIFTLKALLHNDSNPQGQTSNHSLINSELGKENVPPTFDCYALTPAQNVAFQIFLQIPENRTELEICKESLRETYDMAEKFTLAVQQCQNNIIAMRMKKGFSENRVSSAELNFQLLKQQSVYRNSLAKLRELKIKTEHFSQGLEQAKINVLEKFKKWYNKINSKNVEPITENLKDELWERTSENNYLVQSWLPVKNVWKDNSDNAFNYCPGRTEETSHSANSCIGKTNTYQANNTPRRSKNSRIDNVQQHYRNYVYNNASNNCAWNEKHTCKSKSPLKLANWQSLYVTKEDGSLKNYYIPKEKQEDDTALRNCNTSGYNNSTPPSQSCNNAQKVGLDYKDTMDINDSLSENIQQLTSERPYSSESRKRLAKTKELENAGNCSNRCWNSFSGNRCLDTREGLSSSHNYKKDLQETEGTLDQQLALVEPNRNDDRHHRNFYSQSTPKICNAWNNSIGCSKNKEEHCNSRTATNQKLILNVRNKYYLDESGKVHNEDQVHKESLFKSEDSIEFRDFIKTVPLTGDFEVDDEIVKFYRTKFNNDVNN